MTLVVPHWTIISWGFSLCCLLHWEYCMPQLERELADTETEQSERPARQTGPCVMVIFGATGDLTARKLFPALYNLAKSKMLSQDFALVGVARNELNTEQFRKTMGEELTQFATDKVDAELRDWLLNRLYFVGGDFKDPQLYTALEQV